jgi:hypothetical protein
MLRLLGCRSKIGHLADQRLTDMPGNAAGRRAP